MVEILTDDWAEYELLDSGDYMRLERFGSLILARSEPRAWWRRELPAADWAKAQAVYEREETGLWEFKGQAANQIELPYNDLKFKIKLTKMSKHVGVFPEQSRQWQWVSRRIKSSKTKQPKVLNLFGYTGAGTLAAAAAGASVVHVDGSKAAMAWARENQEISGLAEKPVRWILDDAFKFVKREVRRGNKYQAIIMDPPAFGRGPKGQVWKVEDDLVPFLAECSKLLADDALFLWMTMYSIESSSLSLANLLGDIVQGRGGRVRCGELALKPKQSEKMLSVSIFGLWDSAQ